MIVSPTGKPKRLAAVRANLGMQAAYRRALEAAIAKMNEAVNRAVLDAYAAKPPVMARDDAPASTLQDVIARLRTRWVTGFDRLAGELADYFAQGVATRSDVQLKEILRRAGFTVRFVTTPAVNDILEATIHENVALIKSIASQHLTQVEGIVMRSVTAGRDLAHVSEALQKNYGVTRRRAALIARDQNNKATAAITRARQEELGIEQAIWRHSHGGNHPRRTHLANDGEAYDVKAGWYDPDAKERVWPGTLINCRCYSQPIIPGFT